MKMTKLTEDMIIARTKSSELSAVKKLNCWGSDLVDVSLVKRLSNVEVLSLSLNKITTLSDFQYCRNLVELYIRRNAIRDLSELCYLQDLTRLRRLLLAENPCVETAGPLYRATVIRCLPNLEVLDNSEVSSDEVDQAMRVGLILEHPLSRRGGERQSPEPMYYRDDSPPVVVSSGGGGPGGRRSSNAVPDYEEVFTKNSALARSPPSEYQSPYIHQQSDEKERKSPEDSPPSRARSNDTTTTNNGLRHRRHSHQSSSGTAISDESRSSTSPPINTVTPTASTNNNTIINNTASTELLLGGMRKVQRSPVQEYYHQPPPSRDDRQSEITNGLEMNYRRGSTDYVQDSGRSTYQESYYDDSPPPNARNSGGSLVSAQNQRNVQNNRPKPRTKPSNDQKNLEQNPAGPKSSNLLSAVLCLIPELDFASLEVVEHAVRRRMDELVSD